MPPHRSRRRWGYPLPIALGCVTLIAVFLFVNLGLQASEHARGSHPSLRDAAAGHPQVTGLRAAQGADTYATLEEPVVPTAGAAAPEDRRIAPSAAEAASATVATKQPEPKVLEAVAPSPTRAPAITWQKHSGKSCQNYAEEPVRQRHLEESKTACIENEACAGIECGHDSTTSCTLRTSTNFVPYPPVDCYEKVEPEDEDAAPGLSSQLDPAVKQMISSTQCFRPVLTQTGQMVNIVLVQRPFAGMNEKMLYQKYKDKLLFLGISSFEDYPLYSGNPFSRSFAPTLYTGMFPGFLHMMHEPEKYFPPEVKTILMSQSDFMLPHVPPRDYRVPRKYDFTLSGSDQDVWNDCVGWSSYAKNWSFVKESLAVMCGEYKLKGVLVATKSKDGRKACTIPDSCKGLMIQTTFLTQDKYFHYLKQSRFAFLPQVHDASPRVSTQALAHDVPTLMNKHISGGWKYLNEKTGEFFSDMSDFRQSLEKILKNADVPYHYEPRKWVLEHYDDKNSGKVFLKYVKDNFANRVKLPRGTKLLIASSR